MDTVTDAPSQARPSSAHDHGNVILIFQLYALSPPWARKYVHITIQTKLIIRYSVSRSEGHYGESNELLGPRNGLRVEGNS